MAHLDQRLDSGLAGRALGHDQDPDGFDGAVSGFGFPTRPAAQGSAGRFNRIERVGLTTAAPLFSVRSVDFDDFDTHPAQVTGQPGPIGTRAFDPNLDHVAERLEPCEQRFVTGRVGLESLGAEQPAQRVQGRSHMNVEVRVDTTGHTTPSFYDGHGHPFLSKV